MSSSTLKDRGMNLNGIGKAMIIVGAILVLIGVIFMMRDKIPRIGRLPGDACVKRDTFVFYFPITTCIIIRMVPTGLFALFRK